MESNRLRRNAGGLHDGMGDSDHLAGPERAEIHRAAIAAGNRGIICYYKSYLAVYITGISRVKNLVADIYGSYPVDGYIKGSLGFSSDDNQKCVRLGWDTSGHPGRKHGAHPHAFADAAKAHILSKGIQDDRISVDI